MKQSSTAGLLKLTKVASLIALFVSHATLAESYQSFSSLTYNHNSYKFTYDSTNYLSQGESDSVTLFSQYFFDERTTLGPLNEFSYINTSSNIYTSLNSSTRESTSVNGLGSSDYDSSQNDIYVGGQWMFNDFIIGGSYGYSYNKFDVNSRYDGESRDYSHDDDDKDISIMLGYLFSDNFLISLGCNEGRRDNDRCGIGAQYNWQLDGTDYIGVKYNFDGDLEDHYLSSQYFFSVGEQSYVKLGVDYNYFNFKHLENENYWHVNASYYFNASTSISTFYGENDFYGVSASYFFNDNYSLAAGYNSANLDRADESEGYFFTLSAQF